MILFHNCVKTLCWLELTCWHEMYAVASLQSVVVSDVIQ